MKRSPIIFVGMHRSGTSMIGRALDALGLFSGVAKDENNEALFFQQLNEWLLSQAGARWDVPAALKAYFWENDEALGWTERYLRNLIHSPRSIQFLGIGRYAAGGIPALSTPWGWKDPRNTFTAPMWLRLFPDAKVISIERHGVDVAESLYAREARLLRTAGAFYDRYKRVFFLRPRRGGFAHSPRCLTLEGGFSLWREYVAQARAIIAKLPAERVLSLSYEDVLADPVAALRSSAGFCGLSAGPDAVAAAAAQIRSERAFAYEQQPRLVEFAARHAADLAALGYQRHANDSAEREVAA